MNHSPHLRSLELRRAKAERERFELSIPCGILAFQASALGHYATSPLRFFLDFSIQKSSGKHQKNSKILPRSQPKIASISVGDVGGAPEVEDETQNAIVDKQYACVPALGLGFFSLNKKQNRQWNHANNFQECHIQPRTVWGCYSPGTIAVCS